MNGIAGAGHAICPQHCIPMQVKSSENLEAS